MVASVASHLCRYRSGLILILGQGTLLSTFFAMATHGIDGSQTRLNPLFVNLQNFNRPVEERLASETGVTCQDD